MAADGESVARGFAPERPPLGPVLVPPALHALPDGSYTPYRMEACVQLHVYVCVGLGSWFNCD